MRRTLFIMMFILCALSLRAQSNIVNELQRDVQVDVLFLPLAADGARVSASMTGVDDYGKVPSFRS